jgi:hypothetical protein
MARAKKSSAAKADHFDPSEVQQVVDMANGETGELLPPAKTPESAWIPDTNGDPLGSEDRAKAEAVQLPAYFFQRFALDTDGNATFQPRRIDEMISLFHSKYETEPQNVDAKQYAKDVSTIVDGYRVKCKVDGLTTGFKALSEATDTWANFVSTTFEYREKCESLAPDQEMPTWLVEREEKMFALGIKARMLRDALHQAQDEDLFGLKSVALEEYRIRGSLERGQQRLAEWSYNNCINRELLIAQDMNAKTREHTQSIFDMV